MRTTTRDIVGKAGQSAVKSQFEKLGWGAIPNPEHDLGTDLWLQPRDDRGVDWLLFCGIQVKTSPNSTRKTKYFKTPELAGGEVSGWWFYEEKDDHFKFWLEHSEAHFVVLHDLKAGLSYWQLVTSDTVTWTPKGGKIFVPRDQGVDASNVDQLLRAASTQRGGSNWEGSAWTGAKNLAPSDLLRYALLAPRLVAPHPNFRPEKVSAEQAIATLVAGRIREFQHITGFDSPYPKVEDAASCSVWEMRLFAGLYRAVVDGDSGDLFDLIEEPSERVHRRVASTIIGASFHMEAGGTESAIAMLDSELARDQATAADHAWLLVQRARAAREAGQLVEAYNFAAPAFRVRLRTPDDPTCLAIAATASQLMFAVAPGSGDSLSETVIATDTVTGWWRSQILSWGLADVLDSSFKQWAEDGSIVGTTAENPAARLRAASLISGFMGDHPGWSQAMSMLCQYKLLSDSDISGQEVRAVLASLRVSGDRDSLTRGVQRILRSGPADAVRDVASGFSLDDCSRSNLQASIALVVSSADVLTEAAADSHAKWAMETFRDPSSARRMMRNRYSPSGLGQAVLDVVRATVPFVSESVAGDVVEFILETLRSGHEALISSALAKVVRAIPSTQWTSADIQQLKLAVEGNSILQDVFDQIFSYDDPDREFELMRAAESGNIDRLTALPDLRRVTESVAVAQVPALREKILEKIAAAQRSEWYDAAVDHCWALTVINMHCPEYADWSPIVDMLSNPKSFADDIEKTMTKMCISPELVPRDVREALIEPLRQRASMFSMAAMGADDIRGLALETMDALRPGSATDSELWTLMAAAREGRRSLARLLQRRRNEASLDTLVLLAYDRDWLVRGTAAYCIASWAVAGIGLPRSLQAIEALIHAPGTHIARQIAVALGGARELTAVAGAAVEHPSTTVRRWATGVLGELGD